MKTKLLAAIAASAMTLTPLALAGGASAHGQATHNTPSQAKAYGKYCQNQSKKRVAGHKGTPFSECVTAMAKLAKGTTTKPSVACAAESHKHVAGQKGTPYSDCVTAGAKLLKAAHKAA